ncbi:MAG: exodeoxyribonuclease VII large subunit, partial [Pseudomonadota bacterium]
SVLFTEISCAKFGKRTELDKHRLPPVSRLTETRQMRLDKAGSLLDAFSYQGVLARGYALVTDADGAVVRSSKAPKTGDGVTLTFADGKRAAVIDGGTTKKRVVKKPKSPSTDTPQGSLF